MPLAVKINVALREQNGQKIGSERVLSNLHDYNSGSSSCRRSFPCSTGTRVTVVSAIIPDEFAPCKSRRGLYELSRYPQM